MSDKNLSNMLYSGNGNVIGSSNTQVYKTAKGSDPYQAQKANFKQTFWDRFINFFGGRSTYDKQLQDLDMQSNLRQDQLNMLEDEALYNSEREKANRERQAGLNPDLQGIGSASESGEYNEPEQTPSSFNYEDSAGQVASAFKGCVDLGLALFTGFTNVKGLFLENSLKGTQRLTNLQGLARDIVDNSLLPPGIEFLEKDPDSGRDVWTMLSGNNLDYDALLKQYGDKRVRYSVPTFMLPDVDFVSKKDKSAFDKFLNQYKRSIFSDSKRYAEYYKYLQARKSSALSSSSPFNSPSYRQLEDVFRPISKLMFDLDKLNLEYNKIATENAKSYESTYSAEGGPSSAAVNDVTANLSAEQLNDYNRSVNEKWNEAQKSVEKFADNNPVMGMIAIILLNYLRSNMPMPKIDLSKHNQFINNDTKNYNDTNVDKVVNINN